jgi:DNA (cytosine-5)-methyltransferase 1
MSRLVGDQGVGVAAPEGAKGAPLFIDAFSGCGGLSLGLLRAGWHGLFAIEKDGFAFETFQANLLDGRFSAKFHWPAWLPQGQTCVEALITLHAEQLMALRGKVALMAGGPPCQGFSSAGRRDAADPRNGLMKAYLQLVALVQPSMVLLENVRGITVDFNQATGTEELVNYADFLKDALGEGYAVYWTMANAADFGVPQARTRFILIAVHNSLGIDAEMVGTSVDEARRRFLRQKRLLVPTTAAAAISDLELRRNGASPCAESRGFNAIQYSGPRTHYQRLMRDGHDEAPTDTRLARHRPEIAERFVEIIARCNSEGRLNRSIGREMREEYGLKKQALRVLDPDRPAPTITSMPDDLLHYAEARTLTVRENARLQGFPDWFSFHGKYTTGGHRRRREVPRFTQVANAVPPPMAEVLGEALIGLWRAKAAVRAGPPGGDNASVHGDVHKHGDVREVLPVLDELAS